MVTFFNARYSIRHFLEALFASAPASTLVQARLVAFTLNVCSLMSLCGELEIARLSSDSNFFRGVGLFNSGTSQSLSKKPWKQPGTSANSGRKLTGFVERTPSWCRTVRWRKPMTDVRTVSSGGFIANLKEYRLSTKLLTGYSSVMLASPVYDTPVLSCSS